MTAALEHANFTVSDAQRTAQWMQDIFGWNIRWQGDAISDGQSWHVGTDAQYLALYQPVAPKASQESSYDTAGGLNHIAVTVTDIDEMERKVTAAGFTPMNHADYEPGRRFYFHDHDDIEYEVVQYD